MSKYRTAIIACGTIARVHARGWLGVSGQPAEIGAIADTNADARREFGDFFGVGEEHRYADYREMLDKERPDFVDVCSWHQQHAEMVIAAAARRPKAILCQKPMAVDLGEADEMLTACERNGVKLMVAFQRPHHATWLKARDLIREGVIGKITQIQLDDGGNILNTNSHNIRLALFLMDEPQVKWVMGAVERTTDQVERGLPAEDACLGLAACDNGATILIQGNLVRGLGQGCRVIGSDGIMELDTARHPDNVIPSDAPMYMPEGPSARYNYEIGVAKYLNASTNGWKQIEASWHDCWSHQCQEAIDWVEGRVDAPISGADRARTVQEVMMALFESARKRQRIYLPLKTRVNPLKLMVESGDLQVEWPGRYERRARLVGARPCPGIRRPVTQSAQRLHRGHREKKQRKADRDMTLQRMDNVLIVVDDLEAAKAFFVELGMELEGEMPVEGRLVDLVVGLENVRCEIAMMRTPDGHGRIELDKFHAPAAVRAEPKNAPVNTLGIHRIMFAVDDIEDVLARLRAHGAELIGEVVQYEDTYRLCYIRGPEGIIVALAEQL